MDTQGSTIDPSEFAQDFTRGQNGQRSPFGPPDTSEPIQIDPFIQQRMDVMLELTNNTQLNEMGLPKAVYRVDLIPQNLFELPAPEQHEIIQAASIPVSYSEGFPTVNGRLFWERFPWESDSDYTYFSEYLKLLDIHGYRSIALLASELYPRITYPHKFQQLQRQAFPLIRQAFAYYCWGVRTKAYDMVSSVAYERLRERRAIETENYHYLQFNQMFKRLQQHWAIFTDNSEEAQAAWQELGILDTIKAMKELVGLQRISAGLPAAAPLTTKSGGSGSNGANDHLGVADPSGLTLEQRLVLLAKKQQALTSNSELSGGSSNKMDELMKDPTMLALAQEIITRSALPPSQSQSQSQVDRSSPGPNPPAPSGDSDPTTSSKLQTD